MMFMGLLMVNAAYIMLITATFSSEMLRVRGLLMLSSFMFAGFGMIVGITAIAGWNLVIGVLNTRQFLDQLRRRHQGDDVASDPAWMQRRGPRGELDVPGFTSQPHLVVSLAVTR